MPKIQSHAKYCRHNFIDCRTKSGNHFSKKSVAGFKMREGMPMGVKVTLRGNMMYNFLENLL